MSKAIYIRGLYSTLVVLVMVLASLIYTVANAAPLNNLSSITNASRFLEPFRTQEPIWDLNKLKHQADLYDCGIKMDDKVFCSEQVWYYKTPVEVRFFLDQHNLATQVQFITEFNQSAYTDLQLSLRKDGFQLMKVSKSGRHFSVAEQLQQFDSRTVNKHLVQFINLGSIFDPIEMRWQLVNADVAEEPEVWAVLSSQKERIEITFYTQPALALN
ncbi:hypothetical protein L4D20_17695 [Vibrio kyushuensis]|uniref:hypothetical protein n=1 Tax=Vibrio kyushuensis TaxID=2910249 RepID=UPI003D0EF3D3